LTRSDTPSALAYPVTCGDSGLPADDGQSPPMPDHGSGRGPLADHPRQPVIVFAGDAAMQMEGAPKFVESQRLPDISYESEQGGTGRIPLRTMVARGGSTHAAVIAAAGGQVDITQLILDDHQEQRRLFAIVEQIDRSDVQALSAVWGRLAVFLEVHAAAEEAIFYPALLQTGIATQRKAGVEDETLDAIRDHNEIRDAVAEVARYRVGSDDWYAAVAGANLANGDHMAEEEREGLTDFRRLAGLQQRHNLAVAFAAYEARNVTGVRPVDKDPATYVALAEEGKQSGSDGALGVGDLNRRR
jgi:hypothetical protein